MLKASCRPLMSHIDHCGDDFDDDFDGVERNLMVQAIRKYYF
jgi:hypothetical protein